mmetsp:Transcript_90177/g.269010  ORF Transcript_90177/g.269010 Transcript_90177/m.269010 type:complete len:362 (-) Transcript_90177:1547-2632(-)
MCTRARAYLAALARSYARGRRGTAAAHSPGQTLRDLRSPWLAKSTSAFRMPGGPPIRSERPGPGPSLRSPGDSFAAAPEPVPFLACLAFARRTLCRKSLPCPRAGLAGASVTRRAGREPSSPGVSGLDRGQRRCRRGAPPPALSSAAGEGELGSLTGARAARVKLTARDPEEPTPRCGSSSAKDMARALAARPFLGGGSSLPEASSDGGNGACRSSGGACRRLVPASRTAPPASESRRLRGAASPLEVLPTAPSASRRWWGAAFRGGDCCCAKGRSSASRRSLGSQRSGAGTGRFSRGTSLGSFLVRRTSRAGRCCSSSCDEASSSDLCLPLAALADASRRDEPPCLVSFRRCSPRREPSS